MAKTDPNQQTINVYWTNEMLRNKEVYLDSCSQLCMTTMSEDAISHFKLETPNGDSDIESNIFDWAVDFSNEVESYPSINKFLSAKLQHN